MNTNSSINHEQYMLLSQLCYQDGRKPEENPRDTKIGSTINELLEEGFYVNSDEWDFSKIIDWEVLSYQNNYSTTGFSGTAYKNSNGKIVFAMRGTEQSDKKVGSLVAKDFLSFSCSMIAT